MKGYAVFDFDKTLTNSDTLFGFYRLSDSGNKIFIFKYFFFLFYVFLYKIRIISNRQLKKTGVTCFLAGKNKNLIMKAAQKYANKIVLNEIYYNDFLQANKNSRLIISASYEEYLKFLFPDEIVIGSRLKYKNDNVIGLDKNMFGKKKLKTINELGIEKINKLYTDSLNDRPLMTISREVYLVKSGEKERIK